MGEGCLRCAKSRLGAKEEQTCEEAKDFVNKETGGTRIRGKREEGQETYWSMMSFWCLMVRSGDGRGMVRRWMRRNQGQGRGMIVWIGGRASRPW